MTSKQAEAQRRGGMAEAARREARIICDAITAGKKVWLNYGGDVIAVAAADDGQGEGTLHICRQSDGTWLEVDPSSIMPGGRAVWCQIEIEG